MALEGLTSSLFAANILPVMDAHAHPRTFEEARTAKGLTQQEVADFLGITRQAIGHWENRGIGPEGPTRRLLAQLFDVPLEVIDSWFARAEEIA